MNAEVEKRCKELFSEISRGGAALSVWQDGEECFSLHVGDGWHHDSLVPVFSVTKLLSAACFLRALDERGYDSSLELGELWARFPVPHGTVAQLLSHQLGLAALSRTADLFDLDDCRAAIEETRVRWSPPTLGYHPHTLGPILDILMLELCGERLCNYWEREIRSPYHLDVYLGAFPESLYPCIRSLRPPRLEERPSLGDDGFYSDYQTQGTLVYEAFHSVRGIESIREMNSPRAWHCGDPAKGAVASARGLAHFYQLLLSQQQSPFPRTVREQLMRSQARGLDLILKQDMCYSCGALLEKSGVIPIGGFGHAGAGGSHACCQPSSGSSFAFVMDQMEWGVLPSKRVGALLECVFPT